MGSAQYHLFSKFRGISRGVQDDGDCDNEEGLVGLVDRLKFGEAVRGAGETAWEASFEMWGFGGGGGGTLRGDGATAWGAMGGDFIPTFENLDRRSLAAVISVAGLVAGAGSGTVSAGCGVGRSLLATVHPALRSLIPKLFGSLLHFLPIFTAV